MSLKRIATPFGLIFTLFLVACTVPNSKPSNPDAAFIPAPAAEEGKVNLYLVRTYAEPTMRGMKVLVDGIEVAKLGNFKYTWIAVEPGKHTITTDWAWDTQQKELDLEVDVKKEMFIGFGAEYALQSSTYSGGTLTQRYSTHASAFELAADSVNTSLKGFEPVQPK